MERQRWERISALFTECLKIPRTERHRFVYEACNGDTGLAREILELVAEDEHRVLEPPVRADVHRLSKRTDKEDLSGTLLGPYRLGRVLGSGGMGAVYLARREEADFEQEVAIKLIRRGMGHG